mmetsp:Transcript_16530/g.39261  ORF Transcript_16530/g.39261 Transcript_16530/m.39261 type:complete len:186 (-) Transcript_16530:2648-3205(-)
MAPELCCQFSAECFRPVIPEPLKQRVTQSCVFNTRWELPWVTHYKNLLCSNSPQATEHCGLCELCCLIYKDDWAPECIRTKMLSSIQCCRGGREQSLPTPHNRLWWQNATIYGRFQGSLNFWRPPLQCLIQFCDCRLPRLHETHGSVKKSRVNAPETAQTCKIIPTLSLQETQKDSIHRDIRLAN